MENRVWLLICITLFSSAVMASWGVADTVVASRPAITAKHQLTDKERLLRAERQIHYLVEQNQVEDLRALQVDLRGMRGKLEENVHEIEMQKAVQKKFYLDLDARLSGLQLQLDQAMVQIKQAKSRPVKHAASSMGPVAQGDLTNYKRAFDLLQAKHHAQAIIAFEAYIKQFPKGRYRANSWYWLGSMYLQQSKFGLAMSSLHHVVQDYHDSQKVPAAWYKIATIYHKQGKQAQAKQALNTLVTDHGDDEMVARAKKALQTWW
jgi:tol-pal system protein YbgF